MEIDRSDLLKIYDAVSATVKFHEKRDEINSYLHLGEVRYSPLTVRLQAECSRIFKFLDIDEKATN